MRKMLIAAAAAACWRPDRRSLLSRVRRSISPAHPTR